MEQQDAVWNKQTSFDLFTPTVGIILEHKWQEIIFSAVHQETEQGKAPALEEQELWHAAHAANSVLLCL